MPRFGDPAPLTDADRQRQGVGAFLLRDAMIRALSVAQEVGVRLILVHAISETARSFYLRHGFEDSPTDPFNLQILIKDIRKSLGVDA